VSGYNPFDFFRPPKRLFMAVGKSMKYILLLFVAFWEVGLICISFQVLSGHLSGEHPIEGVFSFVGIMVGMGAFGILFYFLGIHIINTMPKRYNELYGEDESDRWG
jgi:hypothetical protein